MARISGSLYDDNNINGIYEQDKDVFVAGKEIRLLDVNGNVVASTNTDSNGGYTFDNLAAGNYLIAYEADFGISFSPKDVGNNDAIDSDVNSNGITDTISVSEDEVVEGVNIGCYKFGRIGDRVFEDSNNNGLQDDGEIGVSGVPVRLQSPDGTTVRTTTTDDNGNYGFDSIEPGDYKVTFVAPDGREFTTANVGDDAIDSDANPNTGMTDVFNLGLGENKVTIDAGLIAADVPVETASVGDRVFNDVNGNGIQNANEPGISGAVVVLQTPEGATVSTTNTDVNGIYNFDDLEPGDYKVTFIQPNGFGSVSPFQAGSDNAIDSDANPDNGLMSNVFSLSAGEVKDDIDAGFFTTAEKVDVDLSVAISARGVNSDKAKIQASGTLEQTITVTNNSNETATGVVVGTDLQVAWDVWEPGQTQTEYGTDWVNASTAKKTEDKFFGNPQTIDSTNGTVTVNDIPLAGIAPEKSDIDIQTLDRGELVWELGTPLAPGETATLTFYGQRTFEKVGGTDFHHTAYIINVEQHDSNPRNDRDKVEIKFETPIALDLNGDGIQTLSIEEGVEFDLLNTEVKVNTGWLSGEDALLAVDNNGNGKIDDRSELFGGDIGEGFAKLSTFDSNDDGLVDANDADFDLLQVWQDANENGVTDAGELAPLESTSIAALNTDYTNVFEMDDRGNIHGETSSAILKDGSNIDMVDVYFQVIA